MQDRIEDYREPSSLSRDDLYEEKTYLVMEEMDDLERARYQMQLVARAKVLKISVGDVRNFIRTSLEAIKKNQQDWKKEKIENDNDIKLEWGEKGPAATVENFMRILRNDDFFSSMKFNELSGTPERVCDGTVERWQDVDDSKARYHIEKKYKLSSPKKYDDAIRVRFDEIKYHPVKEVIEAVEWDGTERIATLLSKWLKCEDNEYTREVSRLIFAGGINRIYRPGCKFDDVPILVGTRQGEGKSTFCRWLAIKDDFFREVSDIDGQRGIEAIEGGWICEMSELLALTKAKEVEAVKSYITRQIDTYRRPYDRRISDHKRQCIFIGTTNKAQFLTDKTGNRRYYPVEVNQYGYELFKHENEVKADILQCWAEAKVKLDNNQMSPFARADLSNLAKEAQKEATEEDWREELIIDYVSSKDEVCIRELWHEALGNEEHTAPSRKESNEIVLILQSTKEWVRAKKPKRFGNYGMSKYWIKRSVAELPPKNMVDNGSNDSQDLGF